MFKKLKDKKGFTLVELIVVLVILAILAALLIPSLTGYIDKANKEKVVSETRMVAMAVQTELSEAYGQAGAGKDIATGTKADDWKSTPGANGGAATVGAYIKEIQTLSEVLTTNTAASFEATATNGGELKTVTYNNGIYTCVYDAAKKTYTTTKNESTTKACSNSVTFSAS